MVAVLAQGPQDPSALLDAAVADFERGRIDESVAKFNQLVAVAPRAMPQLWQRGIALYYAGRYDDCRKQFEAHRTVNPDDVENAAWHFLCVARAESPARARAALLPVGPDARVPMREVLELFRGKMTTEQVMAAGRHEPQRAVLRQPVCRPLLRGDRRQRARTHGARSRRQRALSVRPAATCTWWPACTSAGSVSADARRQRNQP